MRPEALSWHGGEFAPGLSLKGAPGFDDWLLRERARLHDLFLCVLEQLSDAEERAGDRKNAIATTRRLLAAEPWREEAARRLIRLLAADGQRAAALVQFEQCRATLQRELGVEPQPETLALVEQLQAGPVAPPHNLPAGERAAPQHRARGRAAADAIARVDTVSAGGAQWWTGEDALLAHAPLTILAQERLIDTAFVPTLVRNR